MSAAKSNSRPRREWAWETSCLAVAVLTDELAEHAEHRAWIALEILVEQHRSRLEAEAKLLFGERARVMTLSASQLELLEDDPSTFQYAIEEDE